MVRQAHNYLAGAVSGTALIAAAMVAFVMLVSFQALRDWPLVGLGGDGSAGSVSPAHEAQSGGPATTGLGGATPAAAEVRAAGRHVGAGGTQVTNGLGTGAQQGAGGGESPTADPHQTRDTPAAAPAAPQSGSGSARAGSSEGATSSGNGGGANGAGGSSSGTESGGGKSTASTPSEAVTGTVDNTVKGVDEATGGALGDAGVTQTTEEAVEGVAGPESIVGGTVDQTVEKVQETVGGLLGSNR